MIDFTMIDMAKGPQCVDIDALAKMQEEMMQASPQWPMMAMPIHRRAFNLMGIPTQLQGLTLMHCR